MSMVKYYYCDFSELIFASMKDFYTYIIQCVQYPVLYPTRAR
jgi:hypothetical protein